MTKQSELEALREFIARLPEDSYLRPWLSSVLPEIECDIRSDFVLSPSLAQTRRQCVAELADARAEAAEIVKRGTAEAAETKRLALAESDRIMANLRLRFHEIHRLVHA